jgi:allantoin racemase
MFFVHLLILQAVVGCLLAVFFLSHPRIAMRLLIINPNTTAAMTEKAADAARPHVPAGTEIVLATGSFGPHYIASRASFAVAGHAALEAYAAHGAGCDAVLLACFGDPGLEAIREVAPVPVVSLIDAACAAAAAGGRRFSIITGGERWGPMLREMLLLRGLDGQLASIRTVAPTGGEIAANPAAAHALLAEACRRCADEDGAEAVILGGAGLIGIAAAIAHQVPVPVICSVQAGVDAVAAILHAGPARARSTGRAHDPVGSIGLSEDLAALFAGRAAG